MEENTKVAIAANTFKKICDNLPYNRNRHYAEIFLEDSRCHVYIPLRDSLIANEKAAKDFFEGMANAAKL